MENKKNIYIKQMKYDSDQINKKAIYSYLFGLIFYLVAFAIEISLIKMLFCIIALILSGYHVISEGIIETILKSKESKKFTPNVHLLMFIASIGAILIGEYSEAALLVIIFAGAHFLEDYAKNKSKKEITNLLNIIPEKGRRLNLDGTIEIIDFHEIKIGDKLLVLKGDQVPTDGKIIKGQTDLNESTITGESIPIFKKEYDTVYGASINLSNDFEMQVTKESNDTIIAKIVELVHQSKINNSKTAKIIKKIEPIYVNVILLMAPIFYLLGIFLFKWNESETFYKTMVFLIASSPCALAVTEIPASLSAISNLARNGVLFKGGNYLSLLSDLKVISFDKTGTLTEGKPIVVDHYVTDDAKSRLDYFKSVLLSMESKSNHPLAHAVESFLVDVNRFDLDIEVLPGVGLKSIYQKSLYTVAKPTYFKVKDPIIKELTDKYNREGKTTVYFSKDNHVLMVIALQDTPKGNVKQVMNYFKKMNIKTVMITGDQKGTANAIAKEIEITESYSNVLPGEKQVIVKNLQDQYGTTLMVGDGINDAPALKQADIGIAMKSGNDITIDVADGVLMKNDLSSLVLTHIIAKKLRNVVMQNIIFSLLIVITLVTLNILGLLSLPLAVLIHEGSTVLVILSGLRLLVKVRIENVI